MAETQRLATLRRYAILDTPPEKEFEDLVALAAHICGTPIALITLIDEHRQWVKAAFGLPAQETARNETFCTHAILQSNVLVVRDATKDARFAENPLVVGEPGIRFYAGSPLVAPDGHALGALCVLDCQPRLLTESEELGLAVLSRHVTAQLELRRQTREMARVNSALRGILEDQRLAELAVREREELNRGVLNSMLAHIAVLDRSGTIVAVNDAWHQFARENCGDDEKMLAKTDIGINYLDVCRNRRGGFSTQKNIVVEGLMGVLSGNQESFAIEYPCHSTTQKRWFLLSATPLRIERGGLVLSHLDITRRKVAEEQMHEQAAFLDNARDAIAARDLDGTIVYWNQGAEALYGWKREEVLGIDKLDLLYKDTAKFKELQAITMEKGEWSGELRQVTKNGEEVTVDARWSLIRDDEGRPKSILAINTDTTEKKKFEAQFLRAQRMESIGTLAGGIAHDLNNILAPIMLSIDILKMGLAPEQTREVLTTIELSAKRGSDIVRQVLSFARGVDGARIEIQPKHLLKELEQIVKDTFPKDIQLEFRALDETWTVLGDPTQIHQVLLNLCVNARDAMPNGGQLTIDVDNCVLDEHYVGMNLKARPGRYVKIRVADTGTGMPPELTDKIFEPFFTTKDVNKGTGLGLSTVMAIVKSHAGLINVYSELGRGTTFTVYLAAMEPSMASAGAMADEIERPRGHGEIVLLVDDEPAILAITEKTLKAFGYRVMTAVDGAEAVALYAQQMDGIHIVPRRAWSRVSSRRIVRRRKWAFVRRHSGRGGGALFSVNRAGGDYQLLASFDGNNGYFPDSECVPGPGGLLYGVTTNGGASGGGTFYSIKTDGTALTALWNFDGETGFIPTGRILLVGNTFYGTAATGGPQTSGTVFRINADGTGFQVLHAFGPLDGEQPYSGVILARDGRLYGTTSSGGAHSAGLIYGLDLDGSNFTVLLDFDFATTGGVGFGGVIQASNGKLYGATNNGGPNNGHGTIYEINANGSQFKIIHTFTDNALVYSSLVQTADDRLYGLQNAGGTSSRGTVFSLETSGADFVIEHNFTGGGGTAEGASPYYGALLLAGDKLVGLTSGGGFTSAGTVFTLDAPATPEGPPPETPGQFYLFVTASPATAPGTATVTVRRTGTLGTATVAYTTADGTAIAGRDYTTTSGVLTFAPGQTDQTISIPVLAAAPQGATLNVQLSNPNGGATLGNPSSLTVTIANSTPPPPSPYVALADAAYTQAAAYFAAGDQANGYFCYASYEYYLYLLDPSGHAASLSAYYQDLAYAYYISYTAAGDPGAALAWYNYYVSFI